MIKLDISLIFIKKLRKKKFLSKNFLFFNIKNNSQKMIFMFAK